MYFREFSIYLDMACQSYLNSELPHSAHFYTRYSAKVVLRHNSTLSGSTDRSHPLQVTTI